MAIIVPTATATAAAHKATPRAPPPSRAPPVTTDVVIVIALHHPGAALGAGNAKQRRCQRLFRFSAAAHQV